MEYIKWLRHHIGHRKTILVYATVVLEDEMGRVLLQRRSDFDWWGLPGGILEFGEDILSCARRELFEETGLKAGPLRLVGLYTDPRFDVYYPNGDEAQQFSVCFAGKVAGGTARPDGEEILALVFHDEANLAMLDISPWYRAMIDDTLHAERLTFDAPGSVSHMSTSGPERQLPGAILAAAVAVVQREDGRLYMPERAQGERSFPARLMRLGETAAETAVRAADRLCGVEGPKRLLGLVSSAGNLIDASESDGGQQVVAAVMLLRAGQDQAVSSESDWVSADDLGRTPGQRNDWIEQVARVLDGGYFVDAYQDGDV